MVNLGKASLHKGGGLRESFMGDGFPKVNLRELLGFSEGPGTQGLGGKSPGPNWSIYVLWFINVVRFS